MTATPLEFCLADATTEPTATKSAQTSAVAIFFMVFSGSPLKEIGQSCGVVFVRLADASVPARLHLLRHSTADGRNVCANERAVAAVKFRVFSRRRSVRALASLWHLCAALQNCHTE